ncbi:hypothetical protein M9Y10_010002 [Tritrichomonas musculus]|uniref:Uncharacterized protein n=1 Tax=Tritrichomonas musculus TaxID=1915356 RepID=A0ABR2IQU7_9EUKA
MSLENVPSLEPVQIIAQLKKNYQAIKPSDLNKEWESWESSSPKKFSIKLPDLKLGHFMSYSKAFFKETEKIIKLNANNIRYVAPLFKEHLIQIFDDPPRFKDSDHLIDLCLTILQCLSILSNTPSAPLNEIEKFYINAQVFILSFSLKCDAYEALTAKEEEFINDFDAKQLSASQKHVVDPASSKKNTSLYGSQKSRPISRTSINPTSLSSRPSSKIAKTSSKTPLESAPSKTQTSGSSPKAQAAKSVTNSSRTQQSTSTKFTSTSFKTQVTSNLSSRPSSKLQSTPSKTRTTTSSTLNANSATNNFSNTSKSNSSAPESKSLSTSSKTSSSSAPASSNLQTAPPTSNSSNKKETTVKSSSASSKLQTTPSTSNSSNKKETAATSSSASSKSQAAQPTSNSSNKKETTVKSTSASSKLQPGSSAATQKATNLSSAVKTGAKPQITINTSQKSNPSSSQPSKYKLNSSKTSHPSSTSGKSKELTPEIVSSLMSDKQLIVDLLKSYPTTKNNCDYIRTTFKKFKDRCKTYIKSQKFDNLCTDFENRACITPFDKPRATPLIAKLEEIAELIHI